MRSPRWMSTILVSLLFVACSSTSTEPGKTPTPTAASTSVSRTSSSSPKTSPGAGLPGSPTSAATLPKSSYDDSASLGTMARTFLRSSPARRLVVEVDYVSGREPSSTALEHLQSVLQSVCDKPGGITVARGSVIQATKDTYSIEDIHEIESRARDRHSSGDTATIWIVYLNGSLAGASGALGVAYEASGAAIFRDRIDDATTAVLLASEIERSVITHETGHLLALVNIGYKSRINHEDPDHPHHSSNKDSVMYWAVDDVSIRAILGGGPPDDFDDADRADLAMLKAS